MVYPLVSVVIPCYNNGRYLAEAIESARGQTWPNIEVIVVDDGSTDDSLSVACRFGHEITVLRQSHRGASAARNVGLAARTGVFVQFLDADDRLESRKIEYQAEYLDEHPNVDIVYGDARYFSDEEPEARWFGLKGPNRAWSADVSWIPECWNAPGTIVEKFLERNLLPINAALVRGTVFNRVGGWNVRFKALEDYEFFARCAFRGIPFQFVPCDGGLALVRSRPDSSSRNLVEVVYSGHQLRVAFGWYLNSSSLRLVNFKRGLNDVNSLKLSEPRTLLAAVHLALANSCPAVWKSLAAWWVSRNRFLRGAAAVKSRLSRQWRTML